MSQTVQDESCLLLVRSCGVQELTMRYFPDVLPSSTTRHLRHLIRSDSELLEKLSKIGYRSGCRSYTPAMAHLIARYLGYLQHYIYADD